MYLTRRAKQKEQQILQRHSRKQHGSGRNRNVCMVALVTVVVRVRHGREHEVHADDEHRDAEDEGEQERVAPPTNRETSEGKSSLF